LSITWLRSTSDLPFNFVFFSFDFSFYPCNTAVIAVHK
jgi:hypothetical protein